MDFPPQPRRPRPTLALPNQQLTTAQQPAASSSALAAAQPPPPTTSPPPSASKDEDEDEISRELARLENLRLNVKQNLTLRPLSGPTSSSTSGPGTLSLNSASASVNLDSHPPTAIRRTFQGLPLNLKSDSLASNGLTDSSGDTASTGTMSTPQSPSEEGSPILYTAISPSSASHINALPLPPSLHSPSDIISHYADPEDSPAASPFQHDAPTPLSPAAVSSNAQPISTSSLLALLDGGAQPLSKPRPLLLDTRPTGNFLDERLRGSINLAIPTLILKRWKKYLEKDSRTGHLALVQAIGDSVQGLQGFVTTQEGKEQWDRFLGTSAESGDASAPGLWNGDIVVYDEEMDEADPLGPSIQAQSKSPSPGPQQLLPPSSTPTTSWLLISILSSLTSSTPRPHQVYWLRGGFAAVRRDPSLLRARHLISGSTGSPAAGEEDLNKSLLPQRGGAAGMDKETAVYTSSPTEMDAPPLLPPPTQPSSTLLSIPSSSSIQSPTSLSSRQRAVSTSAIPSPSTSSSSGMFHGGGGVVGSTTASGFKGRGLLSLKTDVKLPRSKSKQRTQIDVGPVVDESMESPVKENGVGVRSTSSGVSSTSHGVVGVSGGLAPPSRNASSNESHTPTVPSHSPLPPFRKPSPINRITAGGAGGGPSYSYSSMFSEASPSPSPSTTTANLPFPRTPTSSGSGNSGTTSTAPSFPSSPGVGGFLRNRSNTAMLPKLARLDTKSSRERLAPINTNLAATASNTKTVQPPPPVPPLHTSSSSENHNISTTSTNNTTPPADQQQQPQPGMPPKLSLRTTPLKAATLAAPIASPKVSGFGLKLNLPPSPNRAAFANNVTSPTQDFKSPLSGTSVYFSPVQTPSEFARQYPFTPVESTYHSNSNTNFQYASFALLPDPPRTPGLGVPQSQHQQQPSSPTTPLTARPPPSPAMSSALTSESESAIPPFIISTIVPGFLFLGPEMSSEENVEELKGFGVKRILNMAFECEPADYGLDLDKRFEKYNRIPMRDTVEEDRMSKALKEVCDLLDDARLHSAPTYVHCKAGKSRSVTAVMAYLIHANHWTLSSAYKYVVDRRKGVSPNIGFVSELMNFEEQKLGTKSIGVAPDMASPDVAPPPPQAPAKAARIRAAHARDSLPPGALFHTQSSVGESMSQIGVPVTAGSLGGAAVGAGAGEEMEVKDEEGRYRHARRAPKDEATLQPMRRVSKAGLESSWV